MSIIQFMQQEQTHQTGMIWDYVSPSRLSLWLKCPLAFKRRYIDGWKTIPSPALFVGKVTHAVLAHVYRLRKAEQVCSPDALPQIVADGWKFAMENDPPYFEDTASEEKSRFQILDLATAYLTSTPIQKETPIAVENRYEVPLVDPLTGEDFGIPIVGIVDLVLQEDCGGVIVDFKTASTSSMSALQHELQLTAYAYCFREATEQNELRCEVRQLVKTKTPKVNVHRFPTRSDEHFSRFFGLIREYLDALDRGVYNYRPGWSCSMCEHHGMCC